MPSSVSTEDIFHDEFNFKSCVLGNAKDIFLGALDPETQSDLTLLKSFCDNEEGLVVFEETDEITNLFYRHSLYLRFKEERIIEVVATKELVANEKSYNQS